MAWGEHLGITAPNRYCLARCYCGSCPQYVPMDERPTNTPETYTAIDRRAILSSTGRRTSLADHRQAQSEQVKNFLTQCNGQVAHIWGSR